jgi:uncharacterized heparinase superfamily protein
MAVIRGAALYWHTLRHLTWGQVGWRVYRTCQRKLPAKAVGATVPAFELSALERLRNYLSLLGEHEECDSAVLEGLRRGEVTFLSLQVAAGTTPPWRDTELPRLWLYHLHSFDHLMPLCQSGRGEADANLATAWMEDWVRENPVGADIAWDAYPISCRLMNWCLLAAALGLNDTTLRLSMLQQAEYLARHVEWDLQGNHLMKNLTAMVVAGHVLQGGERLAESAWPLLQGQVAAQVLADGGHVERTPRYHVQVLQDLLLCYVASPTPPDFLREAILRMAGFLRSILQADGGLPLFGDTTLEGPGPDALVRLVESVTGVEVPRREGKTFALMQSGFFVLGDAGGGSAVVVKAGAPGAPHQPGHAHGDALSFEMTLGARRLIVDTGVHGYAESPWRAYSRSTGAHNTVVVNGGEQLEAWGVFRVGRRYRMLGARLESVGGRVFFRGAYRAYQGHEHERILSREDAGYWLVVDRIRNGGGIEAESHVHFHPGVAVRRQGAAWQVEVDGVFMTVVAFGAEVEELRSPTEGTEHGWYFPRFGVALPAEELVFRARGVGEIVFGYAICDGEPLLPAPADLMAQAVRLMAGP